MQIGDQKVFAIKDSVEGKLNNCYRLTRETVQSAKDYFEALVNEYLKY